MAVFDLFRHKQWALEPLDPPWAPLPSIYDDIAANLDASTGSLPADYTLPDDAAVHKGGGLRWAAGALDGVLGHHAGEEEQAEGRTHELLQAVQALLRASTTPNLRHLYDLATREGILSIVDEVIANLVAQREDLDPERYHALSRYLARKAGHREAVKLGIAMLGLIGTPEDEPLLMTLGACDEFTLYVGVSLSNRASDEAAAYRYLFTLARRVHGWGRVQVVERLVETSDPEVRAWLLREGFRNAVMYEYLACLCARAGELSKALANPDIDDDLLVSAAELLEALVRGQGGPAEGIDEYEDASRAVASYLGQLSARRPEALQHLITAEAIREYLEQPGGWEARREHGWTEPHRARCLSMAREVLAWPEWRERARDAQASWDKELACKGGAAARILGIEQ